jgi:hypothetical protein
MNLRYRLRSVNLRCRLRNRPILSVLSSLQGCITTNPLPIQTTDDWKIGYIKAVCGYARHGQKEFMRLPNCPRSPTLD